MKLGLGFRVEDLYQEQGLARIDEAFKAHLSKFQESKAQEATQTVTLLGRARALEAFLVELFGLTEQLQAYRAQDAHHQTLQKVKYKFIKRQALLRTPPEALINFDPEQAETSLASWQLDPLQDEIGFALAIETLLTQSDEASAKKLGLIKIYCAWAATSSAGQLKFKHSVLFNFSKAKDHQHLLENLDSDSKVVRLVPQALVSRRGFSLTDTAPSSAQGHDEAHYCLLCHEHGKDSCRKGLALGQNALGVDASGCPLDEKISEFHALRRESAPLAALAMITRDNPMVAATGHRICNDCSRACVFQQQSPVDIPGAETSVLEDVLNMPYGVEIYGLLMRWNPLRARALPSPNTGKRVLVVGLGPAGFTLAHYLLQSGHQVVAIDGQKIEPLAVKALLEPIKSWKDWQEDLAIRRPSGFGGVAEYGITVRWNKNYLKLIRLMLERQANFALFGGVALDAQLSLEDAFRLGFNHVALAMGAGKPKLWSLPNAGAGQLAKGVRLASDFLMSLQLMAAHRADSLCALQLEMPIVVVGAGLTAIDTATEARAYYQSQVKAFVQRHKSLSLEEQESYLASLSTSDRSRAQTFLTHGEALLACETIPNRGERERCLQSLIESWGGVKILYRKSVEQSPAYRLNHEELQAGLSEGIELIENRQILGLKLHQDGAIAGLELEAIPAQVEPDKLPKLGHLATSECLTANTVLLALGSNRHESAVLQTVPPVPTASALSFSPRREEQSFFPKPGQWQVTRFGDMHPNYAGSVVKAMASAKAGAALIDNLLLMGSTAPPKEEKVFERWRDELARLFHANVLQTVELRSKEGKTTVAEIFVQSPAAANKFRPGQFFRLQNTGSASLNESVEPLAMTGAQVGLQGDAAFISTIVLAEGASSQKSLKWPAGAALALMGPCGQASEIPRNKKVLLVGGGLGNAVLFAIAKACQENHCKVTYLAAYKHANEIFHQDKIQAHSDQVIWALENGQAPDMRKQDCMVQGNVLAALDWYARQSAGLAQVEHLLVIGSQGMMAAVANILQGPLAVALHPGLRAFASINAPMQCMMKGICGQCLQVQQDRQSGESKLVFSCQQQDQPLFEVDFESLGARLAQNRVIERQLVAFSKP